MIAQVKVLPTLALVAIVAVACGSTSIPPGGGPLQTQSTALYGPETYPLAVSTHPDDAGNFHAQVTNTTSEAADITCGIGALDAVTGTSIGTSNTPFHVGMVGPGEVKNWNGTLLGTTSDDLLFGGCFLP